MQKDAEAHADEDKKHKEQIETKNRADALVYSTEKSLKEHGDKVDEATREEITAALEELKKAIEGGNAESIAAAEEKLSEKAQKLGEAVYQHMQQEQAQAEGGASQDAGSSSSNKNDDVVDAEVVDENDKK